MTPKRTATILVNWNTWKDTVECLESFTDHSTDIFIIDNFSSDRSVEELSKYLSEKNTPFTVFEETATFVRSPNVAIYLIRSTTNRGFAGGNNFVIQFTHASRQYDYYWLLNTDTTILADTLSAMIAVADANKSTGFVGSVLIDYRERDKLQCCGVYLLPYFGVGKMILKNMPLESVSGDVRKGDFQNGASLLVKREVIDVVGLMDEFFFMYAEESDWQFRAKKKGFTNEAAIKSFTYHKGTVSTKGRRHMFYYYYNRSSMILTKRHFNFLARLVSPFFLFAITFIRNVSEPKNIRYGLKGIIDGLMGKPVMNTKSN